MQSILHARALQAGSPRALAQLARASRRARDRYGRRRPRSASSRWPTAPRCLDRDPRDAARSGDAADRRPWRGHGLRPRRRRAASSRACARWRRSVSRSPTTSSVVRRAADVFQELRALLGRSLAVRMLLDSHLRRGRRAASRPDGRRHRADGRGQGARPAGDGAALADARRAHEMLDRGTTVGKIILQP